MSSDNGKTFALHIGCMDGRVQEPVIAYTKEKFQVDYVDTVTDAGIVGRIGRIKRDGIKNEADSVFAEELRFKVVNVSLDKHGAKGIVVSGHAQCAGNPVERDAHLQDVRDSVTYIRNIIDDNVPVQGVFVEENPTTKSWEVEEVS